MNPVVMNREQLINKIASDFGFERNYVKVFIAYTVRLPRNGNGYTTELSGEREFIIKNERTSSAWVISLSEIKVKEYINRQLVDATKMILLLKERTHYGPRSEPNVGPHAGRNETGHYLPPSKS